MDPKKKNDNKWSSMPPEKRLSSLRSLRDNAHKLKAPNLDRPYDQDWFMGAVMEEGLEQTYMSEIAYNYQV